MMFFARFDSNSANNPSLNLTGDPSIEINFLAETPTGDPGDFVLDTDGIPTGPDPDTLVEIGGVSYTFQYELSGTLPTQNNQGAGQVPDQFEDSAVAIIVVNDYPTAGENSRLFFMPDEQATQAEMDAFGNGAIRVQNVDLTPPPTPICFARGTRIETTKGLVKVEDLRAGDLVSTVDHGVMAVRWIDCSAHQWPGSPEKSKPVLVRQGAIGENKPCRNLVVSPQHRIVMRGGLVRELFGVDQVLAPSKGLTGLPGVRSMSGKQDVVYFHVLLDRHSVLISENLDTESFFPGPTAMRMLEPGKREAVLTIFPALRADPESGYGATAMRVLSVGETRELARRMRNDDHRREREQQAIESFAA